LTVFLPVLADDNDTWTYLEYSFKELQSLIDNGYFTLEILLDLFDIELNQTDVSGDVVCGKGHTRVNIYCGRFLVHVSMLLD